MNRWVLAALVVVISGILGQSTIAAAGGQREAEVARRGAEVMPFALAATTHVFTKTPEGGIERVIVKSAGDTQQIALIREHLRKIRAEFVRGDYHDPASIHGSTMPGLSELEAAKPGAIRIVYAEVPGGAELRYAANDPALVGALHRWFDAQLSDHGHDAMAGHEGMVMPPR